MRQLTILQPLMLLPLQLNLIIFLLAGASSSVSENGRHRKITNCSQCLNGSKCLQKSYYEHACLCARNYEGPDCSQLTLSVCQLNGPGICGNLGVCIEDANSPHGYHCECKHPWTGSNCTELTESSCSTRHGICGENGTCQDLPGHNFRCICNQGFIGLRCEYENPCLSNDVCNGSQCIPDDQGDYRCICQPGFSGRNCHDINECLIAEQNGEVACENQGICTNIPGSYKCQCKENYHGNRCQERILNCDRVSCQNGAACIEEMDTFRCICPPGFEGIYCQVEINECLENKCQNGGQCEDLIGSFRCHCPEKYHGRLCEDRRRPCETVTCLNGGSCVNVDDENFVCRCPQGFEGTLCQVDIDDCSNVTCRNGGACIDLPNDFKCLCEFGYTGKFCEINLPLCTEILEPMTFIGECLESWRQQPFNCTEVTCQNGGVCVGTQGFCHCPIGYTGDLCQEISLTSCENNINPCLNNGQCYQRQERVHNSLSNDLYLIRNRTCQCQNGYGGLLCQDKINKCSELECKNGGVCKVENRTNKVECKCTNDHYGPNCQYQYSICHDSRNPCRNNGTCHETVHGPRDSYTCQCPTGFSGENCAWSFSHCKSHLCGEFGYCEEANDGHICHCFNGQIGKSCPETPPRLAVHLEEYQVDCHLCRNGGKCSKNPSHGGGAICDCSNMARNFTGEYCEIDINECLNDSNICQKNGVCKNTHGSYYCECFDGYSGPDCGQREDPCHAQNSDGTRPCRNGGECQSNLDEQTFQCHCQPGFTGVFCENDIDECSLRGNVCGPHGECIDLLNEYLCVCHEGYTGSNCQFEKAQNPEIGETTTCSDKNNGAAFSCGVEYDFCKIPGNTCENNGICVNQRDGFSCTCPNGFFGQSCQHQVDLCNPISSILLGHHQSANCSRDGTKFCEMSAAGPICRCKIGYHGRSCEIAEDPCAGVICQNHAKCHNEYDMSTKGFIAICRCPINYYGDRCQFYAEICKPDSCMNGGLCVGIPGYILNADDGIVERIDIASSSFICQCPAGIGGQYCELDIRNECEDFPCLNDSTCFNDYGKFNCICKPDYCGMNCELYGDDCINQRIIDRWIGSRYERELCEKFACSSKMGNNICDPECDLVMCAYDGNDCLFKNTLQPLLEDHFSEKGIEQVVAYRDCRVLENFGFPCHLTFNDGKCQENCNTDECLYDGLDCARTANTSKIITTGQAETCQNCGNTIMTSEWLLMSVDLTPVILKRQYEAWKRHESAKDDALNLFFKIEDELSLKISNISIEPILVRKARQSISTMGIEKYSDNLSSVKMQFDNSNCIKTYKNCIRSVNRAAEFLTTKIRKNRGFDERLGVLSRIDSVYIDKNPGPKSSLADITITQTTKDQGFLGHISWKRLVTYVIVFFSCFVVLLMLFSVLYSLSKRPYDMTQTEPSLFSFFSQNGSIKLRKIIRPKRTWFPMSQSRQQEDVQHQSMLYPDMSQQLSHQALLIHPRSLGYVEKPVGNSVHHQYQHQVPTSYRPQEIHNKGTSSGMETTATKISICHGEQIKYPLWKRESINVKQDEDHLLTSGKRMKLDEIDLLHQTLMNNLIGTPSQTTSMTNQIKNLLKKMDQDFIESLQNGRTRSPESIVNLVNYRDPKTGNTLLHIAGIHNRFKCLQALIEVGGNMCLPNNEGRSVLLMSISSGSFDCVAVIMVIALLNNNYMVFSPSVSENSVSPLIQGIIIGDSGITNLILDSMIELSSAISASQDCSSRQTEMTNGQMGVVNSTSPQEDLSSILLDLNGVDSLGRTGLHWAAVTDQQDILRKLIFSGANIDSTTQLEETALMLAAKEGLINICYDLIVVGSNVDLVDHVDRSAKTLAKINGHSDVVDLLDSYHLNPNSFRSQHVISQKEWLENAKNCKVNLGDYRKLVMERSIMNVSSTTTSYNHRGEEMYGNGKRQPKVNHGYFHNLINSSDSDSPGHWSSSSPAGSSPNASNPLPTYKAQDTFGILHNETIVKPSTNEFDMAPDKTRSTYELTYYTDSSSGEII